MVQVRPGRVSPLPRPVRGKAMAARVLLQFVTPAMRLARPILDPSGKLIAGAGTHLGDRLVQVLRTLAVQSVLVEGGEQLEGWQTVRPLAEELGALAERCGSAPLAGPLGAVFEAVARHLEKRAERTAEAAERETEA